MLDLIPSLKLGRALVPPGIASAERVDALRVWLVQCGRVPVRTLVGRVGKGTVPLHLEHVYSKLRTCAASWASWIRGMHKIIEALWTVHELHADIAVAAQQVPMDAAVGPSSSDASSESGESEPSDGPPSAGSVGDLPPPGDPPDQPSPGNQALQPAPAQEAVMLMGLGDLVGRGGAGEGLGGGAWDSGGQDGEGVWAYGGDGGGSDGENTGRTEEDQSQQGLAAYEGGRVEQGQQIPGARAGGGGGSGEHVMSLQDLRAPSLLGSLWELVGSLG